MTCSLFLLLGIACSQGEGGGAAGTGDETGTTRFGNDPTPRAECKEGVNLFTAEPLPEIACTNEAECPSQQPICGNLSGCAQCAANSDCCATAYCLNGACSPLVCTPDTMNCVEGALQICGSDGTTFTNFSCAPGTCEADQCVGCSPGESKCLGQTVVQCKADGSTYTTLDTCGNDAQCVDGKCFVCFPGQGKCEAKSAYVCDADGAGFELVDTCKESQACVAGVCQSPCTFDPKFGTNVGCDYWAADLDNHPNAQDSPFAVIVSNLGTGDADVTVSIKDGPANPETGVASATVAPGALHIFELPSRQPGSAGIAWLAYHVESTAPIVAYQFNPLDNVDVFSNDASLLLPSHTFGNEYIVVSRDQTSTGVSFDDQGSCEAYCGSKQPDGSCMEVSTSEWTCQFPSRSTATVMAAEAETWVNVKPSTFTLSGFGTDGMVPGKSYDYLLQPYQTLTIKSDFLGGDLTGTEITSTAPVAVFGGHEARASTVTCCQDHLEQQMFPVVSWGKKHVAAHSMRRDEESDHWRVVAAADNTLVTFSPEVHASVTLNRGEFMDLSSNLDFVVLANGPVSVSQLLASSQEILSVEPYSPCTSAAACSAGYTCEPYQGENICWPPQCTTEGTAAGCPAGHRCRCFDTSSGEYCSCAPIGDPALILASPVEQFRSDYVFLVPNKYLEDYITIIAPTDTAVTLDDTPISVAAFTPVGDTGYAVARLAVTDGAHAVNANKPISVIVYGYDAHVSYGYSAGMNLGAL
jgi:hypothetical protein